MRAAIRSKKEDAFYGGVSIASTNFKSRQRLVKLRERRCPIEGVEVSRGLLDEWPLDWLFWVITARPQTSRGSASGGRLE